MKRDEFEKILDGILNDIRKLFIEKRSQYANDEEVLHNFKDVALSNNTTPEDALWGFVSKHWSSIKLMINSDKQNQHSVKYGSYSKDGFHINDDRFTYAQYKDKCMDVINYMILLMAIIKDREQNKISVAEMRSTTTEPINTNVTLKDWTIPDDTPTHE
jgi:hypothetical protein